jgi:hypothetical protein
MKKTATVLFTIFALALVSFYSPNSSIPFEKALSEKKIEIVILPTGGHSGECISIKVKNLTNKNLNLEMTAGTTFIPENEEEQTLIMTSEQMLVLDKSATKTVKVAAYCTEASDRCPSVTSKFQLAQTQNPKLKNLTHFLDSLKGLDENMIQQSIWCVTDSESVSNVYTDDLKTSKALRGYLCAVTGQKDTWYNTRREVSVDRNNRIVSVAKEIKGDLEFTTTEPIDMQGVVVDSTGKEIYRNPNKIVGPSGKIRFKFKLQVEGWAPGKYAVVYNNNGKEVIRQEFSF